VIQLAVSLLTALTGLTSARAAWLWYLASQVDAPKTLEGFSTWVSRAEPNKPNVSIDVTPIIKFVQDSGQRNTAAAQWSAAAAALAFLAGVLSAYAAWPSETH
jgi:hypothetical protein